MPTCQGKTKTGASCRAAAGKGGLCFFHANPHSAKTLGQIGGQKNRRSPVDLEVPDNMTAAGLCAVTGKAMRLLLSGEMGAREASAFAQLCNSFHRILPTVDLETRVAKLEDQLPQEMQTTLVESGLAPAIVSTGSPTDGIEVTENEAWAEPEQTAPCSAGTIKNEEDAAPCPVATNEQVVEEAESPSDGFIEGEEPS
ncbi:MAG: hypothetical protein WBV69_07760 [Candidatus Sulfotelmatobacter sp.]